MTIYIMFSGESIVQDSNIKYCVLLSYRHVSNMVRTMALQGTQPIYTLAIPNGMVLEYEAKAHETH